MWGGSGFVPTRNHFCWSFIYSVVLCHPIVVYLFNENWFMLIATSFIIYYSTCTGGNVWLWCLSSRFSKLGLTSDLFLFWFFARHHPPTEGKFHKHFIISHSLSIRAHLSNCHVYPTVNAFGSDEVHICTKIAAKHFCTLVMEIPQFLSLHFANIHPVLFPPPTPENS